MPKENAGVTIRETNRILVVPEPMYAGGMYRVPGEIQTVEWEREYMLNASGERIEIFTKGGV